MSANNNTPNQQRQGEEQQQSPPPTSNGSTVWNRPQDHKLLDDLNQDPASPTTQPNRHQAQTISEALQLFGVFLLTKRGSQTQKTRVVVVRMDGIYLLGGNLPANLDNDAVKGLNTENNFGGYYVTRCIPTAKIRRVDLRNQSTDVRVAVLQEMDLVLSAPGNAPVVTGFVKALDKALTVVGVLVNASSRPQSQFAEEELNLKKDTSSSYVPSPQEKIETRWRYAPPEQRKNKPEELKPPFTMRDWDLSTNPLPRSIDKQLLSEGLRRTFDKLNVVMAGDVLIYRPGFDEPAQRTLAFTPYQMFVCRPNGDATMSCPIFAIGSIELEGGPNGKRTVLHLNDQIVPSLTYAFPESPARKNASTDIVSVAQVIASYCARLGYEPLIRKVSFKIDPNAEADRLKREAADAKLPTKSRDGKEIPNARPRAGTVALMSNDDASADAHQKNYDRLKAIIPDFQKPYGKIASGFATPTVLVARQVDRLTSLLKWEPRVLVITSIGQLLMCMEAQQRVRRAVDIQKIERVIVTYHRDGNALTLLIRGEEDMIIRHRKDVVPDNFSLSHIAAVLQHENPSIDYKRDITEQKEPLHKVVSLGRNLRKGDSFVAPARKVEEMKRSSSSSPMGTPRGGGNTPQRATTPNNSTSGTHGPRSPGGNNDTNTSFNNVNASMSEPQQDMGSFGTVMKSYGNFDEDGDEAQQGKDNNGSKSNNNQAKSVHYANDSKAPVTEEGNEGGQKTTAAAAAAAAPSSTAATNETSNAEGKNASNTNTSTEGEKAPSSNNAAETAAAAQATAVPSDTQRHADNDEEMTESPPPLTEQPIHPSVDEDLSSAIKLTAPRDELTQEEQAERSHLEQELAQSTKKALFAEECLNSARKENEAEIAAAEKEMAELKQRFDDESPSKKKTKKQNEEETSESTARHNNDDDEEAVNVATLAAPAETSNAEALVPHADDESHHQQQRHVEETEVEHIKTPPPPEEADVHEEEVKATTTTARSSEDAPKTSRSEGGAAAASEEATTSSSSPPPTSSSSTAKPAIPVLDLSSAKRKQQQQQQTPSSQAANNYEFSPISARHFEALEEIESPRNDGRQWITMRMKFRKSVFCIYTDSRMLSSFHKRAKKVGDDAVLTWASKQGDSSVEEVKNPTFEEDLLTKEIPDNHSGPYAQESCIVICADNPAVFRLPVAVLLDILVVGEGLIRHGSVHVRTNESFDWIDVAVFDFSMQMNKGLLPQEIAVAEVQKALNEVYASPSNQQHHQEDDDGSPVAAATATKALDFEPEEGK